MDETQRDLRPPIADELDQFGLEDAEEIGRGGFGIVYRCVQRALERVVAVKVLSEDLGAEHRERFLREEHAMGRLSGHPNIVDILQVDVTMTGRPFIVMPFHGLGALDAWIRDRGPLGWQESLRIGVKLCGALESAHRAGILHRDVKPANILLTAYGEPELTDFGIARVPGGFQTSSSLITGSPAFTAPEVLRGDEPTVASDIYGLGATLFCLITGHAAFERRSGEKVIAQFIRITTQPVPDLRAQDIPDDVAAAIELAMAMDVDERPATAADFGTMLQDAQRGHGLIPDEMALLEDSSDAVVTLPSAPTLRVPPVRTLPPTKAQPTLPPSAAAKFRPPELSRAPLQRRRLLDKLRAGHSRRLAVIHAPAGFGKSTLAAQWVDTLTADGAAAAWLSIDDDDNNAVFFAARLVEAVHRVRPDVGADLAQMLEERADDAVQFVLSALVDQIHSAGSTVVVVVDDWHRVTDDNARAAMEYVLENACHHLRFVVTSRDQTGLPLSRMRVRDELVEIDAGDLRMTADETREFLVERNDFTLTYVQLGELFAATEGWPAAVQLVALSLREGVPPAKLVADLSGGHHVLGEYLTEHVMAALEPEMVEFLMAISVVERVNGSLATALSGNADGRALLDDAQRRDLFLHRTNDDPDWFKLQLLFAEFLRRRLEREHPGRTRTLHLKASRWFAEHQMLRESVDHAMAAADVKVALDLIEVGGMDLIENSKLATFLGTVAKLPMQQVTERSKVLLALARANVRLQQHGAARNALSRLTGMLSRGSEPDVQRLEAAALRAADSVSADRVDGAAELVADVLERPENVPAWVVSIAANVTSLARIRAFDFDGAIELQRQSMPFHRSATDPLGEVIGWCYAGLAAREKLDIDSATKCFVRAVAAARERAGENSQGLRWANALTGQLAYQRGHIEEAAELTMDVGAGPPDFLIASIVTGARIAVARDHRPAALARLREGAKIARDRDLPRLAAHVDNERIRLGDLAEPTVTDPDDEIAIAAGIRALLAAQRLGAEDEACDRARALVQRIGKHDRPYALLEAQLLLADCLAAAGWRDDASETARVAAATCAASGLRQLLVDAGPRVGALLA